MSTLQLKTPDELYKVAPDLATIAERLENSVKNTAAENAKLQSQKRKNKDTPGDPSSKAKIRYPEHFRIIEILKQGRWEKIPSEMKFGKEEFEREITTIASTRKPQALKISIFVGKRKTTTPEAYTIYFEESAKDKENQAIELGNAQESEKIKELESKFVELHKANGSAESTELLKADFARQLNDFKQQSEIRELKRDHERAIEKKDAEIDGLNDDIEDLEAQLAKSDGELSGAAELINAKQKPPAMQELAIGILYGIGKKFAIENPKYLSAVTNKSPEEVKQMLISDDEQFTSVQHKVENNSASFTETTTNEYDGYEPEQIDQLKNLHVFAKSLNAEDLSTFYNICAYCCLPDGSINKEHADLLTDLITPKP
ncbi:MAG: hypothetical protein A3F72_19810 [Bacteroidetes bacterium RIFCSPLOWO2_12_FULL_35_15]|nr:MAG: hypothetical protein A3F72_19810 [Bacteroidetes bacterium RIFCSPLOWO2_12_FULL_35_15]